MIDNRLSICVWVWFVFFFLNSKWNCIFFIAGKKNIFCFFLPSKFPFAYSLNVVANIFFSLLKLFSTRTINLNLIFFLLKIEIWTNLVVYFIFFSKTNNNKFFFFIVGAWYPSCFSICLCPFNVFVWDGYSQCLGLPLVFFCIFWKFVFVFRFVFSWFFIEMNCCCCFGNEFFFLWKIIFFFFFNNQIRKQ